MNRFFVVVLTGVMLLSTGCAKEPTPGSGPVWTSSLWGSHVDTTGITGSGSEWALISEVVQVPIDSVDFCYDLRMLALEWNHQVVLVPFTDLFDYEVINLKSADQSLVVTHCPLTKTTMVFEDETGAYWHPSGYLMHDNLILQDTAKVRRSSQLAQMDVQLGSTGGVSWELYPSIELPFWLAAQSFPQSNVLLASHKGTHNTVCEVYDNSYAITSFVIPRHTSRSTYEEVSGYPFEQKGEVASQAGTNLRVLGVPEWDIMAAYQVSSALDWDTATHTLVHLDNGIHYDVLGRPIDTVAPQIPLVPGMFVLPQPLQDFFPERTEVF